MRTLLAIKSADNTAKSLVFSTVSFWYCITFSPNRNSPNDFNCYWAALVDWGQDKRFFALAKVVALSDASRWEVCQWSGTDIISAILSANLSLTRLNSRCGRKNARPAGPEGLLQGYVQVVLGTLLTFTFCVDSVNFNFVLFSLSGKRYLVF